MKNIWAVWLFMHRPTDLDETEKRRLVLICQASPTATRIYELVQDFMDMLRQCEGERLDGWLKTARDSHIKELQSFVRSIERDKAAVLAGLTFPHSNGPLEGNVNRLKLIKRSMYGRAEFDLLKLRVLHRSTQRQARKDKKKNHQGQQVDRLKKPKMRKNSRNAHHITTGTSEVA